MNEEKGSKITENLYL